MTLIHLVIMCLAVYRMANMLSMELGVGNIFEKLRQKLGVKYNEAGYEHGTTILSIAVLCVGCTSMILGLLFTLLYLVIPNVIVMILLPFALSAITVIIKERGT